MKENSCTEVADIMAVTAKKMMMATLIECNRKEKTRETLSTSYLDLNLS